MLVFKAPISPTQLLVDATTSAGQDSSSLAGWSIRDKFQWYNNSNAWVDGSRSEAIRMAIKGPSRVTFDPGEITRELNENTGANQDVGSPVTAAYTGTCTLTHTLVGADAASFQIDSATGQIKTRAGVTYDHEARSSYTVTVAASDANCGAASATVTINVNNVDERPRVPREVVTSPTPGSYGSITVRWTPPDNTGRPDITGYDVESQGTFLGRNVAGNSITLPGLRFGRHDVRVRAKNAEGDSDWSHTVAELPTTPVQFVEPDAPFIPLRPGRGRHLPPPVRLTVYHRSQYGHPR